MIIRDMKVHDTMSAKPFNRCKPSSQRLITTASHSSDEAGTPTPHTGQTSGAGEEVAAHLEYKCLVFLRTLIIIVYLIILFF